MTVLLWLGAWVAATIVLVGAWCAGHSKGRAQADHQWHQLFRQLGIEHGHQTQKWEALVDELEDQVTRADLTIDMLRRNDGIAFAAGQQLRADRETWGLD